MAYRTTRSPAREAADYIVVGAGTAGCALAARLASDPDVSVLLIEAGQDDRSSWLHIPIGYYKTVGNPTFDWGYRSAPQTNLNGRTLPVPRGRVVGGTGVINGLAYSRGHRADYDRWEGLGVSGWGWSDVLPYFERIEGFEGDSDAYGVEGPLKIRRLEERRPICEAFVASAVECGLPKRDHFNGEDTEGVGYTPVTIGHRWRSSTATAYLKSARRSRNLSLRTTASCEQIIFDGTTAVGVRYRHNGESTTVLARREVVLCAGTIGSPQILQLSGVGPGGLVARFGIDVVADLPGVGRNLQDHFNVESVYELNAPLSLNDDLKSVWWKAKAFVRWLRTGSGPLATSAAHVLAFARSGPAAVHPDLQFHFIPLSLDECRRPDRISGVSVDVCHLRPRSRGSVAIVSPKASASPSINFNFLSADEDVRAILAGLRLSRRIVGAPPFSTYVRSEIEPGPDVVTDDDLLGFARARGATVYHPVGTCRMGSDSEAVVDEQLQVVGVQRLRVADCSVLPDIISGNTNACAIMIAERAADLMKSGPERPALRAIS